MTITHLTHFFLLYSFLPPSLPISLPLSIVFFLLTLFLLSLILVGLDYSSTTQIINFLSSGSRIISIAILDDTVYEGDESFTIHLRDTTMGGVNLTIDTLNITIQEDDSETDIN